MIFNAFSSKLSRVQKPVGIQCYAKKSGNPTKKPRTPKRQVNEQGRNVLMEYDEYFQGKNIPSPFEETKEVAEYRDDYESNETGLTEHYEFPKQVVVDHKKIEQDIMSNLAGKTAEQLLRLKFDKTPLTPERFDAITQDSAVFLKMLQTPVAPTSVVKLKRFHLSEKQKDLTFYIKTNGDDIRTYTSWIRAMCRTKGGYERCLEVVDMLKKGKRHELDICVYNSLLTGLVGKNFEEIKTEKEVIFKLFAEERLQPDATTYTTIIDAIVKQRLNGVLPEEQIDYAFKLVEESQNVNIVPQPCLYTSLIKGCLKAGDALRAWKAFDHMRVWNCQPDIVLYTEMLHVCSETGEAEKALDLFDELQIMDLNPDGVTYNALLSSFKKRPDMVKDCFAILQQMKDQGFKPTLHTWRHLMEAVSRGGDFNTASLLFDEVWQESSTDHTRLHWAYRELFETFARGCRKVHKNKCLELTEKAYNKFLSTGCPITAEILDSVLHVYCSSGTINRALELREKYLELGIVPTHNTYSHLIAMFSHYRRTERALDIFNQMKLANFQPTLYNYSCLLSGCTKVHFVMSGMRLLREMKEKGIALEPYHRHIMYFRRNLSMSPFLIREIDHLTGKDLEHVPGWKKVGGRHQRPDWRNVAKKERDDIAASPAFLPPEKFVSGRR